MRSLLPLCLAGLVACGPTPREVTDADPDVARIAAENNAFTLDMMRAIDPDGEENTFLSPFSMNAALSMTMAGARGDTLAEMQTVLHADPEADRHGPLGALLRDLSGDHRRAYTLNVANRIWGQDDRPWEQDFLDLTREDYGAETVLADIQSDPEGTRSEINDWVSDQTRDKIPELLPGGAIDASTMMVLVNAIYFKADWASAFEKSQTGPATFTRADGSTTQVEMMRQTTDVAFVDEDGFVAAGIPYGEDADLRLWVLLPDDPDGLPALEAGLTAEGLASTLDGAATQEAELQLPKLETRTKVRLAPVLAGLGMPTAFGAQADFSGMLADGSITIDEVYHEAYVMMDEEGTEAAAATAVVTRESAAVDSLQVLVDRPYLFLIRDELTGAILFTGRIVEPTASEGPA
jgi:serpin B